MYCDLSSRFAKTWKQHDCRLVAIDNSSHLVIPPSHPGARLLPPLGVFPMACVSHKGHWHTALAFGQTCKVDASCHFAAQSWAFKALFFYKPNGTSNMYILFLFFLDAYTSILLQSQSCSNPYLLDSVWSNVVELEKCVYCIPVGFFLLSYKNKLLTWKTCVIL